MRNKRIGIIDYELGNLYSIHQAINFLGFSPSFVKNADDIKNFDSIILPGVGAFNQAMNNIKKLNLNEALIEYSNKGKPLLGICLGMQLLFSYSEEFGMTEGLNLIRGKVIKFKSKIIPHVGWNEIKIENKNLRNNFHSGDFYFVHSYFVQPKNMNLVLSTTFYENETFTSSIIKNNILGFQFHPEKSGKLGIKLLKNWLNSKL
tara:strand:+ start:1230 stop:1841 length:612 start_codon:yes stop_codon:yes gene_type:complete